MTTFAHLSLDLLLRIATITSDHHVYAALNLAVSRLGRALITKTFDTARWQDTLTTEQRTATLAAFCETGYIITRRGPAVATCLAGHFHSFGDAPSIDSRPDSMTSRPGLTKLIIADSYYDGGFVKELRFFSPDACLWHRHGDVHRANNQPAAVYANGTRMWIRRNEIHRDDDLPAIITPTMQSWYRFNRLHRDRDRPAVMRDDGDREWFVDGMRHREGDQPAAFCNRGRYRMWYQHGQLHRDGDRASIESDDVGSMWYRAGRKHRDNDQPAIVRLDGERAWFTNGVAHRDGGRPARISDHGLRREWYIRGQRHRDGGLPTIEASEGDFYYLNGQLYPGPALRRSARLAVARDMHAKRAKQ